MASEAVIRDARVAIVVDLGTGGPKVGFTTLRGEVLWAEHHVVQTERFADGGAEQDARAWWDRVTQTLRAVIDWSYDLLGDAEQRLLERVTVFSGGWTLDAAEDVGAGGVIDRAAVFELTERLVARSLMIAADHGFQTRYRLLETIRQYGEERLAEHDETEHLRARHAEYYTGFARVVSEQMLGPDQIDAGRRFGAEHENLLAAMSYAIDTDNVDLAFRLLHNTSGGPIAQVGYLLLLPAEPILGLTEASEHPLYPFGLAWDARLAALRGDAPAAETLCERALAAAQHRGGSDPDQAVAHVVDITRSVLAFATGATHDAAIHAEHAVESARSIGQLASVAVWLSSAAMYHTMAGEADTAAPLATEGLALARRLEIPTFIAMNLAALAGALTDQDPQRAKALLRESIQLRASLDYEAYAEITQAVLISARLGDWPQTLTLASSSIRHLHWNGDRPLLGAIFNIVARAIAPIDAESAAVLQGAARRLVTAAMTPPDAAPRGPQAEMLTTQSGGPASSDHTDFVTELRRATTGLLHDALGEARLRELRAEGEGMDYDHAVAYALDAIDGAS